MMLEYFSMEKTTIDDWLALLSGRVDITTTTTTKQFFFDFDLFLYSNS